MIYIKCCFEMQIVVTQLISFLIFNVVMNHVLIVVLTS